MEMRMPKPTMEFYFNENRGSDANTSDPFSLQFLPHHFHTEFRERTYNPKYDMAIGGRASPGNDLGYHTLLTRDSVASSPTLSPTVSRKTFDCCSSFRWSDSMCNTSPRIMSPRNAMSSSRSPKISLFDRLSDEVILKIFSFLSSYYLCVCARVCRRWYFLAWEPRLWTSVCLSSEKISVDRGLKTLFRLLCRDSPTVCLAVDRLSLNGCSGLTDKGMFIIAKKCPQLKYLDIRGCVMVTNAGVSQVLSRCIHINRLDLTGCHLITTLESRFLTAAQLYLQWLNLTDCHSIEDYGLKTIACYSPQLTHLYLRRCVQITDSAIKAISSFCLILKELSISDCILVTDFGMYELAKLGPSLKYLSVAKCDQISDAGIKQIVRHCYKLRYLNVRSCEAVSDHSMEVLARSCPRLRALDIGKCDVTDNGLRLLSEHCPNLKKLSIKSCDMITDEGIQAISFYCRGLQQLNIQDCNITLNGYRTVKKFCKRCIIEHTNPGFF